MSGSGNDFVFVDGIDDQVSGRRALDTKFVQEVCAAHTGVGADGIAVFQRSGTQDFKLDYLNRDGSVGELCGNASLCAVRLGVELGHADPAEVSFETGAGVITGRIRDGVPQVDLQPVRDLRADAGIAKQPGESAIGFANTGVPHLVIVTDDIEAIPLGTRGPELRHHPSLRKGANVNWVAQGPDGQWLIRTYERGVEGETLACGTGAVASAALLQALGLADDTVQLLTRSGRTLTVMLDQTASGIQPTLSGEGRIVFEGELREL